MDILKFLLLSLLSLFWFDEISAAAVDEVSGRSHLSSFWNSLTPEQQQLIRNHNSKGSLIERILAQSQAKAKNKRNFEQPSQLSPELQNYFKNLPPEEQELLRKHPSQAARLGTALQDAQQHTEEEEDAIAKRQLDSGVDNRDWPAIFRDMMTHINALKEISRQAAERHDNLISVDDLKVKILEDVKLAKEKGIKLEDLLMSLNKQGEQKPKVDHFVEVD